MEYTLVTRPDPRDTSGLPAPSARPFPPPFSPPPPDPLVPVASTSTASPLLNTYTRAVIALVAAVSVVVGVGVGAWFVVTGVGEDDSASAVVEAGASMRDVEMGSGLETSTSSVATNTATPPPGATVCRAVYGPVGPYTSSATGTAITSCPFAEEVRIAYASAGAAGAARQVRAFSPVTKTVYDMSCAAGQVVTCRGGNDAVVYVY